MAVYEYATNFDSKIEELYKAGSRTNVLVTPDYKVKFLNAQTLKVPVLSMGGYGDHDRSKLGFNSSELGTKYNVYQLTHDRDVEYFIDPMDVDETKLAASIANVQVEFEKSVKIPEMDKYRLSKLYKDAVANGAKIDNEAITAANALKKFDAMMEAMDDAEVPEEGRILFVTPTVYTALKQAEGLERYMDVKSKDAAVNRAVHSLDDVQVIKVPSARMKSDYADTGTGTARTYAPTSKAVQINMMLVDPSAVICVDKYDYIRVFTPGSDSRTGDNYVYQNRSYGDLFLIKSRKDGVAINAAAAA